jgi:hypothetical protein
VAVLAPDLILLYLACEVKTAAAKYIFDTIHHLFVFCPQLADLVTPQLLDRLLNTDDRSPIGIQMLFILRDSANHSILSGACVGFALASAFDENGDLLVRMIDDGLEPAFFAVPASFRDWHALRLANALWRNLPETHSSLRKSVRTVVRRAMRREILRLSPCLREAIGYLGKR